MSKTKQRILFIHQNFPAQFVHVAQELAGRGHEVVALGIKGKPVPGVRFIRYVPQRLRRTSDVELARDFEAKVVRASACAQAMLSLRDAGFTPDIIVAHPGWGEPLFCKDVFPNARLVVYAEFFYGTEGQDYAFDPEFMLDTPLLRSHVRLKNSVHLHAFAAADTIYTPTQWQRSRLPAEYQHKVQVAFDGIDTKLAAPNPTAAAALSRANVRLVRGEETITFVNRNLEPYRGFHVFMRALPEILARRPKARCVIVGGDEVSYGGPPNAGGTWREVMLREVGDRLPHDRVHFVGKLPYRDYLRLLQLSACHVYLTYPFVLSWSCLEAMSVGCTVVASATQPVREVIQDNVNGLLFHFFDKDALAHRVEEVLARSDDFAELGRKARQTVVTQYDLETVCLPKIAQLVLGG